MFEVLGDANNYPVAFHCTQGKDRTGALAYLMETLLDMKTSDNEDGYNKQKDSYKDLVAQILENNASGKTDINAFVVWGITDDLSWIQGNQAPLLFSSSFEKKPAYYGMQEALLEFLQGHEEAED